MRKPITNYDSNEPECYCGLMCYLFDLKSRLDNDLLTDEQRKEAARELKESVIPSYRKVPSFIKKELGRVNIKALERKCDEVLE